MQQSHFVWAIFEKPLVALQLTTLLPWERQRPQSGRCATNPEEGGH
jgi:hypothetical protein